MFWGGGVTFLRVDTFQYFFLFAEVKVPPVMLWGIWNS